jgi:hypothetical protein
MLFPCAQDGAEGKWATPLADLAKRRHKSSRARPSCRQSLDWGVAVLTRICFEKPKRQDARLSPPAAHSRHRAAESDGAGRPGGKALGAVSLLDRLLIVPDFQMCVLRFDLDASARMKFGICVYMRLRLIMMARRRHANAPSDPLSKYATDAFVDTHEEATRTATRWQL